MISVRIFMIKLHLFIILISEPWKCFPMHEVERQQCDPGIQILPLDIKEI